MTKVKTCSSGYKKKPFSIRAVGNAWQVDLWIRGVRSKKSFRWTRPSDPEALRRAKAWAVAKKADEFRGEIGGKPERKCLPFEVLAAHYLDHILSLAEKKDGSVSRSMATYRYYRDRLAIVCRRIGSLDAHSVKRSEIHDYMRWLRERAKPGGYGESEIAKHITIIGQVFNWGIETDKVAHNPAAKMKKEKTPRKEEPYIYSEEEQQFILSRLRGLALGLMLAAFKLGLRKRYCQLLWMGFFQAQAATLRSWLVPRSIPSTNRIPALTLGSSSDPFVLLQRC